MKSKKAVCYYRVSTKKQGKSGLGLEAQQFSVRNYITLHGIQLEKEYKEVESRKKNNRPILKQALEYCAEHGATLIIAKLDRLGGNVFFISSLMESKVEFVAVDNPHANKLHIHIMAAFAEDERERISIRTREALAAAKRRGVKLGKFGREVLSKRNKQRSIEFAKKMQPIIRKLTNTGFKTLQEITDELNRRKIPTYRKKGSRWHLATVHKIIQINK